MAEFGTLPTRTEGLPDELRVVRVFLSHRHFIALDQEIITRKAHGNDKGPDGKRINLNRSMVIRDILDAHFKKLYESWPTAEVES